jgi:ferritin
VEKDAPSRNTQMTAGYILLGLPMLAAWWCIYKSLEPFAGWLARHLVQSLSAHARVR